jgi:hypothetical protein
MSKLVNNLVKLPLCINDRLMTFHTPLNSRRNKLPRITLISVYTPTMANPFEAKDKYYDELNSVISSMSKTENSLFRRF